MFRESIVNRERDGRAGRIAVRKDKGLGRWQ